MVDHSDLHLSSGDPDRRARGRETLARFRSMLTPEDSASNDRIVDALMTKSDPGDLPELLAQTIHDHGEDAVCEICDLLDKTSRRSPPMAEKLFSDFQNKLAGAPETLKPARFRGLGASPAITTVGGQTRLDDMLAGMEDLVKTDGGRRPLAALSAPIPASSAVNDAGRPVSSSIPPSSRTVMNPIVSPDANQPSRNAPVPSNAPPSPPSVDKLFKQYRHNLKRWEGAYSDRKVDPGGPTQKGMSQKQLDKLRAKSKWEHLPAHSKDLTDAQIDRIFREEYFDRLRIAKLEAVPGLSGSAPKLSEQTFDISILHGVKIAGLWLQKSLDDVFGTDLRISEEGKMYYDGNIGPATRKAVEQAVRSGNIRQVNNAIANRRLKWMRASPLLVDNPGWIPRAEYFKMEPFVP